MNVTALARQLKVSTKELLEKLPGLGFDIGTRAIKVDDRLVPKIVSEWKRAQKKQSLRAELSKIKEISDQKKTGSPTEEKREITVNQTIVVKDMAEQMHLPVARLMAELMRNGIMVSLNEKVDFDTATIIAEDLGYKVVKTDELEKTDISNKQRLQDLLSRREKKDSKPPVVVVMGHVDHGKTKLLDAIRKTNVVDSEAGGITQHIGAYQVEARGKTITFLDTPGHEAFKAMRSRGGQIADVAILVVAADDGLQPQTLESISVIQKENLPFVVAINKIDKEGADIEKVKKELSEINLVPEEWGGKVIIQPISAKQGQNINELLDMILLVAELTDLKADKNGAAVGTIIESHVDKGEGPVATVLVQAGTLKIGDMILVGNVPGKIKILKNWKGESVQSALPSTPVKILGLKQLPAIGEILEVIADKKLYKEKIKSASYHVSNTSHAVSADEDNPNISTLNVIIKSDVLGSAEAIEEALHKINVPETRIKVVKKGLGQITEADVLNAEATTALLIGFHIKENKNIVSLAHDKKVTLLHFDIIYKLLEDIETRLKSLKGKKTVHKVIGKLKVLAVFKSLKDSMIVGGKVIDGKVAKGTSIKVLRNGELESIGKLGNLQSAKQDVSEAVVGNEAGLEYKGDPIIQVGDELEFFVESYE